MYTVSKPIRRIGRRNGSEGEEGEKGEAGEEEEEEDRKRGLFAWFPFQLWKSYRALSSR